MSRFPGVIAAVVIATGLLAGSVEAREAIGPQRLSLAISGGASKGAYEAGLNWAILKLLRDTENQKTMRGGHFRPLSLASAAGASAGGINTILSALIWCARPESEGGIPSRIDSNVFRDMWMSVDINSLLPPNADSELYLPDDAVLSRTEYFVAARKLKADWNKTAFRKGCRVPLGVTVTRVLPKSLLIGDLEVKNQRFYIPFELRVQDDGSVAYFFDPADYPNVNDPAMILMPHPRNAPAFSISDDFIVEAAVTTSAFPTAFGRRRLKYCRLELRSGEPAPDDGSTKLDSDLICPKGYVLEEAEFADGGLFDNLPVGLARILAESNLSAEKDLLPVTYVYMDPDRIRYESPKPPDLRACASDNPPHACKIMEFSFFSESTLLTGAVGTARKLELYREATSEAWQLNMSRLSYELAGILDEQRVDFKCENELPYFDAPITCADAIRRTGSLLERIYDNVDPVISTPFSPQRLVEAGLAEDCEKVSGSVYAGPQSTCHFEIDRYRNHLADALISIISAAQIENRKLVVNIGRSRQSPHNDRILRVSSRGAPITGTLLSDFGSFLDLKFREYDYYVGVYDAVVAAAGVFCGLQFLPLEDHSDYDECLNLLTKQFYDAVGVQDSPAGRYVFARLAMQEFGLDGQLNYSYSPLPPVDKDMQIIHEGLAKALAAGETHDDDDDDNIFVTEDTFFEYLHEQNFKPTPTKDGGEPLLAEIITDPEKWPTELTRRFTSRLVYLERQAADLYAEREANPELREASYTTMMGGLAYFLQRTTYKYPDFTFAPSTAPDDWAWRYVIPYEFDFDLVEGDILVTWQPTAALTKKDLLAIRASLGFAGGLFKSPSDQERENYLALGAGYIRRTPWTTLSSVGITPTWYHAWKAPQVGDQDTFGGDISAGFFGDIMRVGVGSRDFSNFNNAWFLTLGFTDLPGLTYWLTR